MVNANGVAIKLREFWSADPQTWFHQAEEAAFFAAQTAPHILHEIRPPHPDETADRRGGVCQRPLPEFIDPVFAKTRPKRSFCMTEKNDRFELVFAKTGSINSGTGQFYAAEHTTDACEQLAKARLTASYGKTKWQQVNTWRQG
jgi:hypothetical protein